MLQAVILCGGKGTRLREETEYKPKPMVEIGGMPILWHIMKIYSRHGIRDFVLCLGYKGHMIKEYFRHFEWLANDFTLHLGRGKGRIESHAHKPEDWNITFADTGAETGTGGRIKRAARYIRGPEFHLTYGDGVADVDLGKLHRFHVKAGRIGTVTGIHPSSKFGVLEQRNGLVSAFQEKPGLEGLINGGFFVFRRRFLDYLDEDGFLEQKPLRTLAADGQLAVYEHNGFWHSMDTYKDVESLQQKWDAGDRPWAAWERPGGSRRK